MATIAIGDVHGNLPALDDLLKQIAAVVAPGDTVVFLGDYIDRGPDSRGCLDRILSFRDETPAVVEALLGNHEDWFLPLIWTVDDEGAHFVLEQIPWESLRGHPSHTNLSRAAYFGGEAWRTGENQFTINGASQDFGYSRDAPSSKMEELEKRYAAAIRYMTLQGIKVKALPLGTR